LHVELSKEEMKEIESGSPFDLGYPHTCLSSGAQEHITTEKPGFAVESCGKFVGVPLVKATGQA
jgi:hypothetical protein